MAKSTRPTTIGILAFSVLVLPTSASTQERRPIVEQMAKAYGVSFGQIERIRYTFNLDLPGLELFSETGTEVSMAAPIDSGIVRRPSSHSVDETVDRLKGILQAKGIRLFALIDHSGEAEKAGLKMRPTKLLIFGNPKAGTPLMLAAAGSAIDLPLKILLWEDTQGKTWVSYNSLAYLQERHGLPQGLMQNIAAIETLAKATAE